MHGKPRHNQSQGSVARANQDIEKMLSCWMKENNSTQWSLGIKFVQFMKNPSFYEGIKQTPFEAMFGTKVKKGLKTSNLPADKINNIESEEQLEDVINQAHNAMKELNNNDSSRSLVEPSSTPCNEETCSVDCEGCTNDKDIIDNYGINEINVSESQESSEYVVIYEERVLTETETVNRSIEAANDQQHNQDVIQQDDKENAQYQQKRQFDLNRIKANEGLDCQGRKMLRLSNLKFPEGNVGDTVRLKIPDVDRGRSDPKSILLSIVSIQDHEFYKLGNKNGTIKQLYTRNQFVVCKQKLLNIEEVSKEDISLREIISNESVTGGQGYKKNCSTNNCSCKKRNILCNSKCHLSLSCCNK